MELDQDLKLVIAIARTHRAFFEKVTADFSNYNLSASEFGVLELLWHKGPQPIQFVASKILVTSGTITYVIDKLVKRNLVTRRHCDKDKRIFYAELTDEGKSLIGEIFPLHHAFIQSILMDFPAEDKKAMLLMLRKFYTHLTEESHV